jgi:hypothetical protein
MAVVSTPPDGRENRVIYGTTGSDRLAKLVRIEPEPAQQAMNLGT